MAPLMVTGGCGFIGSNFIRHLIESDPTVSIVNFDALTYAGNLANLPTSGTWTHDYPITYERALELGLRVRSDLPENMLDLMQLYPQPTRRQPSVEYVPMPYRSYRRSPRAA